MPTMAMNRMKPVITTVVATPDGTESRISCHMVARESASRRKGA